MVAVSYGLLAMDLIDHGRSGRMVALRDGAYTHVPLNRVISGVKRVDVDEMYDIEQYRPRSPTCWASRCSCTSKPFADWRTQEGVVMSEPFHLEALTFDDVLLVPGHSEFCPRTWT